MVHMQYVVIMKWVLKFEILVVENLEDIQKDE